MIIKRFLTWLSIVRVLAAIRRQSRVMGYQVTVFRYGAYWIHPRHLAIWVCVRTDAAKEQLSRNDAYWRTLRSFLERYHYPKEGREEVHLGVESQETVDRESQGDWFQHFK